MVGIAGKSKACHECKRRRVKCGFERPKCLRCTKVGRHCPGYERQVLFVNRTIEAPYVSAFDAISRSSLERSPSQSSDDELHATLQFFRSLPRDTRAFRWQAFKLLERIYLPRPEVSEGNPSQSPPFAWVRAICELDLPNHVLDNSLVALCSTMVFVEQQRGDLYERAIEYYTVALKVLGEALASHASADPEYTIAAIVVVSTCEIFICCTDDGWRAHVQGIADVLRLRYENGVTKMPMGLWNQLCSRLRVISVLSSLTRVQKGILCRAQWHDLMPDYDNVDSLDNLMDMVCELPHALALYDQGSELHSFGDQSAIIRIFEVLGRIYNWQSVLRTKECPVYTVGPAQLLNPSDDAYGTVLFPFAITFRSLQVGLHCVLSWGIQLQIYTKLLKTQGDEHKSIRSLAFQSGTFKQGDDHPLFDVFASLPVDTIRAEADRIARLVCQVIEYCNRLEMGIFGPQTMLFTQWTMRSYFRQIGAKRELSWCLAIPKMYGAPTRCGIRLMHFQNEPLLE